MANQAEVSVRFCAPPPELRQFFTTFYLVEMLVPDGGTISDLLHPEWANLRFYSQGMPIARPHSGAELCDTDFAITGPSSRALPFTVGTNRMWGLGLSPLGWAKFIHAPADNFADAVIDGHGHPEFSRFAPLSKNLFGASPDWEAELGRISAHFLSRLADPLHDEERIVALHRALIDTRCASVADLCRHTGFSQRTLERVAGRVFGFAPKLLLRRQRFLRSLAKFMLDPSLRWIGAIDGQYHDQAQFVRDFRRFMGLSPRQYASMDKPVLGAIMVERARFAGHAVQALEGPEGVSLSR